jgi:hypothetical protein
MRPYSALCACCVACARCGVACCVECERRVAPRALRAKSVDTVRPWQSPVRVLFGVGFAWSLLCTVCCAAVVCALCAMWTACCIVFSVDSIAMELRSLCGLDSVSVFQPAPVVAVRCVRTGSRGSPDTASSGHHRRAAATAGEWYQAGPTRRLVCCVVCVLRHGAWAVAGVLCRRRRGQPLWPRR